jgi:Tol biopolymer transport system component
VTIRARAIAAVLLLVASVSHPADAANRYDPRFRFRTLTTPRFNIYFHQGEESLAQRLAVIAEEVADRTARELGTPNARVHVILVAQNDMPNGWAIPAPYNLIEITPAAPPGESSIGNTDDWLRLVFSHEYTHIVHLDKARGWIGGLRRVFGRSPLFYPNLFLPLWQIEGLATYNESLLTGRGRVPAGDFRVIVSRAAAERRFDPLDRVNGGLIDWPGGTAQYAYGAYFHQYLADRFGPESIARLADDTSGRLPYFGVRGFRKVFGRSLGDLWNDFEADTRSRVRNEATAGVRLTRHGFSVGAPAFSEAGRLFYSVANPHGFPSLMVLERNGGAPRRVADRYLGSRIAVAGDLLVFDQFEFVHNVALQSDLYAVAQAGGPVHRLTERARAADPDVAPDRRSIVCTVQSADRRALATMPLPGPGEIGTPTSLLADEWTDYSSPRWSPDGRSIVAARLRVGGPSEIVVVNAVTRETRTIVSSTGARNVTPSWWSNQTVLFSSDRNGEPFGIYAVELATGAIRKLGGVSVSAQSPLVSPDGRELVFVGYTADGHDLFSLPLASAVWTEVVETASRPVSRGLAAGAATATADTGYRPWRTLVPKFWTPIVESDNGEASAGAATAGMDALGRHAYAAALSWTTARPRPDWSIAYAYDRWWPTLFASVSDDTDPWLEGEIRTREINVGALFVARRVRHSQTVLAEFNASSDGLDCAACSTPVDSLIRRRAARIGWAFDSRRAYGYSISGESGAAVRTTWEAAPKALGSDEGTGAMTFDVRAYQGAGMRHGVVAVRAAGAAAWGNAQARRAFSAAGSGPQNGGFDVGTGAIGLIRGIEGDTVVGDRAAVVNLDYRFPVWSVERGVGTLPVFFRTVHAAFFADAGHAWSGAFRSAQVRVSAGAELSLDAVLGYSVPLTFVSGVAWRDDPVSSRRGAVVFGRIGRAF